MDTPLGIAIQQHPGALTDNELGELMTIAVISRRMSPHYADLLKGWLEREHDRRADTDAPIEPELLRVNYSDWTNAELAAAIQIAVINLELTDNSSPRVRGLIRNITKTITAWNWSRMNPKD